MVELIDRREDWLALRAEQVDIHDAIVANADRAT